MNDVSIDFVFSHEDSGIKYYEVYINGEICNNGEPLDENNILFSTVKNILDKRG